MRPRGSIGEVRSAIREAVHAHGPLSQRDIVRHACVGLDAARSTVENMVRSGELEAVGHERRAHCKKWVALYDLAAPPGPAEGHESHDGGLLVLSGALSAWR